MKTLEVFEPAMCCPTGVCGVSVDPMLAQFAADLQWLGEHGVEIRRHSLGQAPQAFATNAAVLKELQAGIDRLPVLCLDGNVISTGLYPSRAQLAHKLGLVAAVAPAPAAIACCTPESGCC